MDSNRLEFELVVIGGGMAGQACALAAARAGARVALIEGSKVGGRHLWAGCIPAQVLLRSSRVYDLVKRCEEFGVHVEKPRIVWSAIKLRLEDVRDQIRSRENSALSSAGVTIIRGQAHFTGPAQVEVETSAGTQTVTASRIVLATGSEASPLHIEGLDATGYSQVEELFLRPSLPRTLLFVCDKAGEGNALACEMAQAFYRLGSKVTLVCQSAELLPAVEPEISRELVRLLGNEGLKLHLGAANLRAGSGESTKFLEFEVGREIVRAEANTIVASGGRQARTEGLQLETAGIQKSATGIEVDVFLQTSNPAIFACGEAIGAPWAPHASQWGGALAARNALATPGTPLEALESARLPVAVSTDPEVACIGLGEEATREKYGVARVHSVRFATLDRAVIEGESSGVALLVTNGEGKVTGAHLLSYNGTQLLAPFSAAVHQGWQLEQLREAIMPYPSLAEIGPLLAGAAARE